MRALKKSLFEPPYPNLPWAVFSYFIVCFLLHPFSPFVTGHLEDPDDYMRLVQVITWLDGQSWYDLSQPRLSPGAHTIIHWARLVDLPIALLVKLLKPIFVMQDAALVAAMLVPPVLFWLLLMTVCRLAQPFVGADRANLASVITLFAPTVVFNFTPGRVDHHGYQILIAGFGLLGFEAMTRDRRGWRSAILTAIACACGLWIGTEAMPWLILLLAGLAITAAWQGGYVARNTAIFGAALFVASLVIVPCALPPDERTSRALSWFSLGDVIFTALSALVLGTGLIASRWILRKFLRMLIVGLSGSLALGLFLYWVPDAVIGPFADYDTFNSTTALANIGEAIPLWTAFQTFTSWVQPIALFTNFLLLPHMALAALAWMWRDANPRLRLLCAVYGVYLISAMLLTIFWQVRVGSFMQLFTIMPLTWLGWRLWDESARRFSGRTLFWLELAAFMLLGPLQVVVVPALYDKTPFYPDMALFPVDRSAPVCSLKKVAQFLDWKYPSRPYTILAGMNEGPELLFRTQHNVIGGNFNVSGNQDVLDFFHARDDRAALAIAQKWKVDLVLTCRSVSAFYAGLDHLQFGKTAFLAPGKQGHLQLVSSLGQKTLVERLINGPAPGWLKPVEIPGNTDYLLFDLHP